MWFSHAVVQVFSSVAKEFWSSVVRNFLPFLWRGRKPCAVIMVLFHLVFWVAITSASGSWHFCTAMSRNFRQQGDKSETSFSICRTWADPTDSFQPVTANKIYCTSIKVCKAHLHSLNSLQSASPLEHIHVWSFSQCLLSCGLNTILARLHKCLAGSWSSAVR